MSEKLNNEKDGEIKNLLSRFERSEYGLEDKEKVFDDLLYKQVNDLLNNDWITRTDEEIIDLLLKNNAKEFPELRDETKIKETISLVRNDIAQYKDDRGLNKLPEKSSLKS